MVPHSTADCRIFQNRTVPQIIERIFQDLGFKDFQSTGIRGEHPAREYCVQYRETDFNFVSRLMEEEGIFHFFRHEDGQRLATGGWDKTVRIWDASLGYQMAAARP